MSNQYLAGRGKTVPLVLKRASRREVSSVYRRNISLAQRAVFNIEDVLHYCWQELFESITLPEPLEQIKIVLLFHDVLAGRHKTSGTTIVRRKLVRKIAKSPQHLESKLHLLKDCMLLTISRIYHLKYNPFK